MHELSEVRDDEFRVKKDSHFIMISSGPQQAFHLLVLRISKEKFWQRASVQSMGGREVRMK